MTKTFRSHPVLASIPDHDELLGLSGGVARRSRLYLFTRLLMES
jgi:hypothetical protein